jgi:hypothetical protein
VNQQSKPLDNMVKGSCACGDWTYEFEGEPIFTVSEIA